MSASGAYEREVGLWEAYRGADREQLEALVHAEAFDIGPAGPLSRDEVIEAVGRMRIDAYEIDSFVERAFGETKYPVRKMLALAWDAMLSFSYIPLRAASWFGFVVFVLGSIYGVRVFVDALLNRRDLEPGWASIVVLECLVGGAILFCLGMIGEYVGRIYEESKQRPLYIVRRTRNLEARAEPPRAVAPGAEREGEPVYDERG